MISLPLMFKRWRFVSPAEEVSLLKQAAETIALQDAMLRDAARSINEWQQIALASQKSAREVAVAFRLFQEAPELVDVKDELDDLIRDLSDVIAQAEEHFVVE